MKKTFSRLPAKSSKSTPVKAKPKMKTMPIKKSAPKTGVEGFGSITGPDGRSFMPLTGKSYGAKKK